MSRAHSKPLCVCSTIGFTAPEWNSYYPRECPVDWQVAYFMNDFQAVYLKPEMWVNNAGLIHNIAEELEGHFELVIELPAFITSTNVDELLAQLISIEPNIACLVLDISTTKTDQLQTIIERIQTRFTLSLTHQNYDAPSLKNLAIKHGANIVWHSVHSSAVPEVGEYQVVILPTVALRAMRDILGKFESKLKNGNRVALFIEPETNSPECAIQARTLIELLELA